jgi:predicted  nucleic acid-binding Zn-ribbon protein
MAELDKEIRDLKARVAKYETELDSAKTSQEKSELRQTIYTSRETLNRLLDEKKKSLPQGEYIIVLSDFVSKNILSL